MDKKKGLRLAGFGGALCASAALVSLSVSGTGAYFSDSHDGTINASTGQIKIDTTDGNLNFTDLLPGEYQTKTVNYTARPRGGTEDVWLVFPNYGQAGDAFTSHPAAGPTPLGRYGHFAVSSTGGASFTSYNLTLSPSGQNSADSCSIDGNGEGGSNDSSNDALYCAPAHAILLQSNMAAGDAGSVDLTFGFTPRISNASQNAPLGQVEQYKIVATQHGISPLAS